MNDTRRLKITAEIQSQLDRAAQFFRDDNARAIIDNPKIADETSTESGTLGAYLAKKKNELKQNKTIHIEMIQKIIDQLTFIPSIEKLKSPEHIQKLKSILGTEYSSTLTEAELFKALLYKGIKLAGIHWKKCGHFNIEPEGKSPFHQFDFILLKTIMCLGTHLYGQFVFRGYFAGTILMILGSEEVNRPFNWDNFDYVARDLSPITVAGIFIAEIHPQVWEKRLRAERSLLDRLNGDHPYVNVENKPITLNSTQAAFLRVLIEAKRPMHYIELYEAATGETIGNDRGAYKNKAQPGNVFKSIPEVLERYIKKAGKKKSGLYSYRG